MFSAFIYWALFYGLACGLWNGESFKTYAGEGCDFCCCWVECSIHVCCCYCCYVTSFVSDSVRPHRRQPTRLLCPWDSPGKNTGVSCHFLLQCMKVKNEGEVAQSCPAVRDPMDCSLPGSSVHGIFQARALEWGAIAFSIPMLSQCKLQSFNLLHLSLPEPLPLCLFLLPLFASFFSV